MIRYLSVCSGIEAASVAWHPLGWEPVAFAEIDPFASAVLAARHPNVPNLGNMEGYRDWKIPPFDLLVGGTPCQSFSVAGLRRGLDDPRGNLALVYLGLVDRFRPRWVVWENVPGVLSSSGGRDFGAFLGGLAKLGYGFAYRVLDAQYVRVESHPGAVPQRRRRVFVVGCAGGDWKRAAEVLLEPEGVRGDPPTRRKAGQAAARGARAGASSGGVAGVDPLPFDTTQVTSAINRSNPRHGDPSHPLTRGGAAPSVAFQWPVDVADPITANEGGTYTHEGTTFRMHNVVPDAVIGFQSNLGSQGGDVWDGISTVVRRDAPPAVAFSCKDYGGDASVELAPTMRAMPHDGSHPNGGGQLAVAFKASHFTRGKDGAPSEIVSPLSADADKGDQDTPVTAISFYPNMGANARSDGAREGVAGTLAGAEGGNRQAVAAPTLTATNDPSRSPQSAEVTQQVAAVHSATMQVRRLTPRECERLQGFPDDYTLIEYRGKPASDGPRYKALGNSMAVNVMRWVGQRLNDYEERMGRSEHTFSTRDAVCTPSEVYEPIVKALGPIGFDPASHPASSVPASTVVLLPEYWTDPNKPPPSEEECGDQLVVWGDGLAFDWGGMGLVYVNPPYSKLPKEPWVRKARLEADEAVLLLPVRTAGAWWQDEVTECQAITFLRGRVHHEGEEQGAPFHQCLVYCGPRTDLWIERMAPLGWTTRVAPWRR